MTLPVHARATSDGHRFGWIPDLPDYRDHQYAAISRAPLPDKVRLDLDPAEPPIYDQLQLGSCTANGIGACMQYGLRKQGLPDFMPSRLFVYYNERVIERTADQDSGAYIRDGIKVVHKLGVPPEELWRYDIGSFTYKPPVVAYEQALETTAVSYARVRRTGLDRALADGFPVVFGWSVYSNLEGMGADHKLTLPGSGDTFQGGHCTVAVGYQDFGKQRYYRIRNSWGTGWADGGYFWMPKEYVTTSGLSSDFWTIKVVS